VTSLHRIALIINCGSCRGTAYGVALPTLSCHDGIRHFGERRCKAPPVHSLPIVRIASPPATREDLARSRAATTITKSP